MPAITDVAVPLAQHQLLPADLELLRPTAGRYRCFLLQPSGPISATAARIGPLNEGEAAQKGRRFLELARANGAHLAITPEYFLPWEVLVASIMDGTVPNQDALWVLGCESITPDRLAQLKQQLAPQCLVDHEPFSVLGNQGHLLDPVVLLFQAQTSQGASRLVALVQFKTFPSRDDIFFEDAVLKRGATIYRFRGSTGHLAASAVICSDAFPLSEAALVDDLIDRATLIHVQLNPDPRNTAYRAYRARTFEKDAKSSDCHIICLNWARRIVEHGEPGSLPKSWENIAGSTWYCPSDGCSAKDLIVIPNHAKGLYYTHLRERRHGLIFHYDESVYEMQVPKLLTMGPAVMANRNGPTVIDRYIWDASSATWVTSPVPLDPGFVELLDAAPAARDAIAAFLPTASPLDVERLLALTAAAINGRDEWYDANQLDSCLMEADEIVCRITVAQDMNDKATEFRHGRLAAVALLRNELDTVAHWPPQVAGLNPQARIEWVSSNPSFNVRTNVGVPTLVVHLGESPSPRRLENVPDMLCRLLRRAGDQHEKRLCVMYRELGQIKFAPISMFTRFDDALLDPEDILVVQPFEGR